MDRGACRATRVAEIRTQLSDFHFISISPETMEVNNKRIVANFPYIPKSYATLVKGVPPKW